MLNKLLLLLQSIENTIDKAKMFYYEFETLIKLTDNHCIKYTVSVDKTLYAIVLSIDCKNRSNVYMLDACLKTKFHDEQYSHGFGPLIGL